MWHRGRFDPGCSLGDSIDTGMQYVLISFLHIHGFDLQHHPPDASNPLARAIASLLPHNVSIIPEISRFPNTTVPPHRSDIRGLSLVLANGTIVSGYDHASVTIRALFYPHSDSHSPQIILATGYRRSKPFLSDYHNRFVYNVACIVDTLPHVVPAQSKGLTTRILKLRQL